VSEIGRKATKEKKIKRLRDRERRELKQQS